MITKNKNNKLDPKFLTLLKTLLCTIYYYYSLNCEGNMATRKAQGPTPALGNHLTSSNHGWAPGPVLRCRTDDQTGSTPKKEKKKKKKRRVVDGGAPTERQWGRKKISELLVLQSGRSCQLRLRARAARSLTRLRLL